MSVDQISAEPQNIPKTNPNVCSTMEILRANFHVDIIVESEIEDC